MPNFPCFIITFPAKSRRDQHTFFRDVSANVGCFFAGESTNWDRDFGGMSLGFFSQDAGDDHVTKPTKHGSMKMYKLYKCADVASFFIFLLDSN